MAMITQPLRDLGELGLKIGLISLERVVVYQILHFILFRLSNYVSINDTEATICWRGQYQSEYNQRHTQS